MSLGFVCLFGIGFLLLLFQGTGPGIKYIKAMGTRLLWPMHRKGENVYQPCDVRLKLDVVTQAHGFWMDR